MSLKDLEISLTIPAYTDLLAQAVALVNSSPSDLNIRGINSPGYVMLGSQAFISQMLLESFKTISPLLSLNLAGGTATTRQTASVASGVVSLTSAISLVVSDVTLVSPSGVYYRQVSPATVLNAGSTIQLRFESAIQDAAANTPASANLLTDGWGISTEFSLASTTGFTGGRVAETDDALITRAQVALTTKGTPVSADDWVKLANVAITTLDSTAKPVVKVVGTSKRFDLPAIPGNTACVNFYTKPLIQLTLAKQPNLACSVAECASVQSSLSAAGLLHTSLEVLPATIEQINATVIVQTSSPDINGLIDLLGTTLQEGILASYSTGILQQRQLTSRLAKLAAVDVLDDLWLSSVAQPRAKADNLTFTGLPYLKQLALKITTSAGTAEYIRIYP